MNPMETLNNIEIDRTTTMILVLMVIFIPIGLFAADTTFDISTKLSLAGSTACVDGVSEVYISSNVRDYEGDNAWKVQFTNNCNEKIAGGGGSIDEDDIEGSKDGNVVKAESGFDMRLTSFETFYRQGIDRTSGDKVYSGWETNIYTCSNAVGSCGSDAKSNANDWIGDRPGDYVERDPTGYVGGNLLIAYRATNKKGEAYEFSADSGPGFTGQVSLCAQGECDSDTITKDEPTARLEQDEREATVEWRGSRVGQISDVDFSEVRPFQTTGGTTRLASDSLVDEYIKDRGNLRTCLEDEDLNSADYDSSDLSDCTSSVNNAANNAATDQRQLVTDSLSYIDATIEIKDNEVRAVAKGKDAIDKPVFVATIDADWIGIVEQVPKPDIGSIRNFNLYENTDVDVQIPVTNTGNNAGNIRVNVECDTPLAGGSKTRNVGEGETRIYSINIRSGASSGSTSNCDVTAQASGTTAESATDEASFNVDVKKERTGCNNCYGGGSSSGSGGGGTVKAPEQSTSINWIKIILAIVAVLGLTGGVYWLLQRFEVIGK